MAQSFGMTCPLTLLLGNSKHSGEESTSTGLFAWFKTWLHGLNEDFLCL